MNNSSLTDFEKSQNLVTALLNPDLYPEHPKTIKLIETHISWLLLTGSHVYKIKKPVNFGFLDYSSLERRKFFCQEEVRLNCRLAPQIYDSVVALTGSITDPKFNGSGAVLEYAVKMKQFGSGMLLSEIAQKRELSLAETDEIAAALSIFHRNIACTDESSEYGNAKDIQYWVEENFSLLKSSNCYGNLARIEALHIWSRNQFSRWHTFMQQRKSTGFVRECHGDLHLGNMTKIDGKIVFFDCIEFNPQLRWIDVINEVAFIFMDLFKYGQQSQAYRLLNRYLLHTGDYSGLMLLSYYSVYRAMVRAKVCFLIDSKTDAGPMHEIQQTNFMKYLKLAEGFAEKPQQRLFITFGFSGSGKSFLSDRLAESIPAIIIKSDVERKRLFGYQLGDNTQAKLSSGIYSRESSDRVYRYLLDLTKKLTAVGYSVIVDATFLNQAYRTMFFDCAEQSRTPVTILKFEASIIELKRRIRIRNDLHKDASEADECVLDKQLEHHDPLTDEELKHTIVLDTEREDAIDALRNRLTERTNISLK